MTYDVKGEFHEACDCEIICSCWAGYDPEMGSCTGLFAWNVQQGSIDGTDVAGGRVVILSQGTSCDTSDHMMILVDGSADQRRALRNAVRIGPWGAVIEAANGTPEYVDAEIVINASGLSAKLLTPEASRSIEVEANYKFTTVTLVDNATSRLVRRVTGNMPSNIEVGTIKTSAAGIGLNMLAEVKAPGSPPYIFDLDISRVTAMRGKFHYIHP
jgi:hypothetical protein